MSFKKSFNPLSIIGARVAPSKSKAFGASPSRSPGSLGRSPRAVRAKGPRLLGVGEWLFSPKASQAELEIEKYHGICPWVSVSGFTLLEILIAIAILVVVATLVYASFDASIKVMDGVNQEADIYRDARLILTKLSEDLSMAYMPKGLSGAGLQEAIFVGQDGVVEDRPQDSLKFTSLSHVRYVPNQPTSDLNLIEYTLEADPEGKGWALLRKESANLYSLSEGEGQYVIGEGIQGFNLRYFDGKTWVDSWDSASHKGLPWVVEIEIQFREPRGDQRSFKSWVELALAK